MTIQLTKEGLREIWGSKCPQAVIDAFVAKQAVLDAAGITHTRVRLTVALTQVEHETNGFTIPNLTENINYTAARAAAIWPSRFKSAADVQAKYGTGPGWQLRMFDDVYGGRMGNRPGTRDGSTFIGHGGPQVTGLDGHLNVGKRMDPPADLVANPALACRYDLQPEVLAGFWTWKNLNPVADSGGLKATTKPWNGGYIGMADREARYAGNDPVVLRMQKASVTLEAAKKLPGAPPTAEPPKETVKAATENERKARAAGVAAAGAGAGNEGGKAITEQPSTPPAESAFLTSPVAMALIAGGIVLAVIATIAIAKKASAVRANWF